MINQRYKRKQTQIKFTIFMINTKDILFHQSLHPPLRQALHLTILLIPIVCIEIKWWNLQIRVSLIGAILHIGHPQGLDAAILGDQDTVFVELFFVEFVVVVHVFLGVACEIYVVE